MAIGLTTLLKTVVDNKASGLHIRGNSNAYVRINTKIREIEDCFLTNDDVKKIAAAIMGEREKKMFEQNLSVDFALDAKEYGRFRFNVFRQSGKMCMAIRHIPLKIPSFEQLNLPGETLKKIADNHRGIILVTGMTGSGKSSTLAAMIDHINKTRSCHIITVEDPVEFVHSDQRGIVSQLSLGTDTLSYSSALRYAMRQDPNVIMLGEMRDAEVIRSAIAAAEMGQLVLSTLHTVNAVQTIARVIESFPPEYQGQVRFQLADLLRGVISQRLLPKIGGGLVPAVEIMLPTAQIKKNIVENKVADIQKAIAAGEYYGMQTFDEALIRLHKEGKCKLEDILDFSTNPDGILLALRGLNNI
ncbi:type IV pilus twitching motility protein PilT [Candidatus Proelusimicrobium excrementi]|uniref:type IV pilus twitching motility protein PilT n=2 Tax=Candidatus Proelusimicrobium excrementi TaxID=3416222 RepID=UPI003CB27450|nr:PilT/PilU family type 4a pilus ATPase [Elusimicrobiaceae bacterium]